MRLRLTPKQKLYAEFLLSRRFADDEVKPAVIDGGFLVFETSDDIAYFLDVLAHEASYDAACGARTSGAGLWDKIQRAL